MTTHLLRHRPSRRRAPVPGVGVAVLAVLTIVAALGLAACGDDGEASTGSRDPEASGSGPRTVEIEMVDNAFEPSEVEVTEGETVRFAFRNTGAVAHDAIIGDEMAQDEHEQEMRTADEAAQADEAGEMGDDMGHGSTASDEEGAITVEPGATGELTYTFAAGEQLFIGCHEPGHYDAGMRLAVGVTAA